MLYENHLEQVARYVVRRTAPSDVQDVVAETFLAAWRRFDELPEDSLPWLFATARNMIANRQRSARRHGALQKKLVNGPAWVVVDIESQVDLSHVDERLWAAIAALPDAEREAFLLVAWDGLDTHRASRAAGCSAAAFRMRLHRARRRLRQQIVPPRPFRPLREVQSTVEEAR